MTSFLIFLAIIVALIAFVVGIYNKLVNFRNRVKNAFAQIDVQLTRRYDLIPNLVEAVKGYMKHERETLDAVISARNICDLPMNGIKNFAIIDVMYPVIIRGFRFPSLSDR